MAEFPMPPEGIVLAHFVVSDDVERSRRFYTEVNGYLIEVGAGHGPGRGLGAGSLAAEHARQGVAVNAAGITAARQPAPAGSS
jgi:hypothetical protein